MIHWLGMGLSSYVGLKKLNSPFVLWVREVERGQMLLRQLGRIEINVREFSTDALLSEVHEGDIVVSMFPAPMHVEIAKICLEKRAHLVTSSYVSPPMQALHALAVDRGCVLLNEVGLDPGLDHLFAHELFARNESRLLAPGMRYRFRSLCGGMPLHPEQSEFRYRFSWSPAGVLRALTNSARWIEEETICTSDLESFQVREVSLSGLGEECFELYPNRDSVSYVEEYVRCGFERPIQFMRGTLRPKGWAAAWSEVFRFLKSKPSAAEIELRANELAKIHSYQESERDRVVLHVELEGVDESGAIRFGESIFCSITGEFFYTSAMSKMVSIPVLIAVSEIEQGAIPAGVNRMPSESKARARWFKKLSQNGLEFSFFRTGS